MFLHSRFSPLCTGSNNTVLTGEGTDIRIHTSGRGGLYFRSIKKMSWCQWLSLFSGSQRSATKYLAWIGSASSHVKLRRHGIVFDDRMSSILPTTWFLSTTCYPVRGFTSNVVSQFGKDGMLVFNKMSSLSEPSKVILTLGDFCLLLGH